MRERILDARRVTLAVAGALALGACAGSQPHVALEPGVQRGDAVVDWETGSITLEQQGVVVSAQGAILPAPHDETLHPTFWVTVRNNRDGRISVRPTDARLVDPSGRQLEPVPMTVDRGGHEVRYAVVQPEIRAYVGVHYGWPYYPLYPYPGWFSHPPYGRWMYWGPPPFWTFGFGPVWITGVHPRPVRASPPPLRDQVELVYSDAELTYVVIFPETSPLAGHVRLIVPEIGVRAAEGGEEMLDFELVFEQLYEPD